MAFSKSCIQPVGSQAGRVQELCLAPGTVRKEMVDSRYRILSNLKNCDFVGKYSS